MRQVRKVLAVVTVISGLVLGACSVFGVRSGTEEPHFTVVDRFGTTEIRRYEARLAAETTVPGSNVAGRSEGFRRLAGYIFGGNVRGDRIAMTAPVAQSPGMRGEAIARTVPMAQAVSAEGSVIRFFLPAALLDPPRPNDDRVRVVSVPADTIAVRRYTGLISDAGVETETKALLSSLTGTRWTAAGMPVAWFYDPPWTLPPLRRNEVAVSVVAADATAPDSTRDFGR